MKVQLSETPITSTILSHGLTAERYFKQLQANFIKIYIISFFRYFLLFLPVIVPYFSSIGLSNKEILSLQSIAAFTFFVFEVPTGYFSDHLSKKWALILSATLRIIAVVTLLSAKDFQGLAIFEFLFSLGLCFDSGTETALLYDTIEEMKILKPELKDEKASKMLGSRVFWLQSGEAVSALIGGIIASYSLTYTIYGNLIVGFLPLFLCFSLVEPHQVKKDTKEARSKQKLIPSLIAAFNCNAVRSCVLFLVFINLLTFIGTWTFQIRWKEGGLDVKYFGYFWAAYNIAIAISAHIAPWIEKRMGAKKITFLMGSLPAIGFLGMCGASATLALASGLLIQVCRGLQEVVTQRIFNDLIPTAVRATANSVISLGIRGSFALAAPFLGMLIDEKGIQYSYLFLAAASITAFLIIFALINRSLFHSPRLLQET